MWCSHLEIDGSIIRGPHRGDGSVQVVLTKIVTAKESTNAFSVIQAILAEGGVGGFYKGIQVRTVLGQMTMRFSTRVLLVGPRAS